MISCTRTPSPPTQTAPVRSEQSKPTSHQKPLNLGGHARLPQAGTGGSEKSPISQNLSNVISQHLKQVSCGEQQRPSLPTMPSTPTDKNHSTSHSQTRNAGTPTTGQHTQPRCGTDTGNTGTSTHSYHEHHAAPAAGNHPHQGHHRDMGTGGSQHTTTAHHEHHTDTHETRPKPVTDCPTPGNTGTSAGTGTTNPTPDTSLPGTDSVLSTGGDLNIQIRGLLQGPFNQTTGLMNDDLRNLGLLPTAQPYAQLSAGYTGTETASATTLATTGNDAPVDWVLIELRDKNNPDQIVTRQAALIQRDGDVADAQTNSSTLSIKDVPPGEYFVTLLHRNHLGVMTSTPINLSGTATQVDFTKPATVAGNQTAQTDTGTSLLWAGDANSNNSVIASGANNDLNAILNSILSTPLNPTFDLNYQASGYLNADVNMDGKVIYQGTNTDSSIVNNNVRQLAENTSGNGNFILNGSVTPGTTAPATTTAQQALQDSLWF